MTWEKRYEIPEAPGFYWFNHESVEEPLLVEIAIIHEPEVVCRKSGMRFDPITYNTVRLCSAMKMWPDRVIKFPSMWAGPIVPPSAA